MFAISFFLSRIVVFPLVILRNVGYQSVGITIHYIGAQLFYLILLGVLQVLHVFWFSTIAVMVCLPFGFSS